MKIGNREFDTVNKTYIMGILNVTPDSFSDGGRWDQIDAALQHVEAMEADGMDIVDVGGESTRPDYIKISDEEEIERITPVIEAIQKRFDLPISVDTYKPQVAKAALLEGAHLINDIWGLKYHRDMAKVIAEHQAVCCLMHNKAVTRYDNFMTEMLAELEESVDLAKQAEIARDKIILDPGVGFAKTYQMNLESIRCLESLCALGYPVLLGTSRKSVIGKTLDLPADQRLEGTLATTVMGMIKGCSFVRVHDIKENRRVIQMTEAILGR